MRKNLYLILVLLTVAGLLLGSACLARADDIHLPIINNGAAILPHKSPTPTSAPPEPTMTSTATPVATSTPTASPTVAPTVTETATPVASPTSTPTPTAFLEFGFENGINGWNTSEGEFKLAEVIAVGSPVRSGAGALGVVTELRGQDAEVYHHTETTRYFAVTNLQGRKVELWAYFPASMLQQNGYLEALLFVKSNVDGTWPNQYAPRVRIDSTNVDHWIKFDLTIGTVETDGAIDSGFDPKLIGAVGLRVEAYENFIFKGHALTIDDVRVGFLD